MDFLDRCQDFMTIPSPTMLRNWSFSTAQFLDLMHSWWLCRKRSWWINSSLTVLNFRFCFFFEASWRFGFPEFEISERTFRVPFCILSEPFSMFFFFPTQFSSSMNVRFFVFCHFNDWFRTGVLEFDRSPRGFRPLTPLFLCEFMALAFPATEGPVMQITMLNKITKIGLEWSKEGFNSNHYSEHCDSHPEEHRHFAMSLPCCWCCRNVYYILRMEESNRVWNLTMKSRQRAYMLHVDPLK